MTSDNHRRLRRSTVAKRAHRTITRSKLDPNEGPIQTTSQNEPCASPWRHQGPLRSSNVPILRRQKSPITLPKGHLCLTEALLRSEIVLFANLSRPLQFVRRSNKPHSSYCMRLIPTHPSNYCDTCRVPRKGCRFIASRERLGQLC